MKNKILFSRYSILQCLVLFPEIRKADTVEFQPIIRIKDRPNQYLVNAVKKMLVLINPEIMQREYRKDDVVSSFNHKAELYECDVSIPSVQARIEQLSLKTNQFNLTTRRLIWQDIKTLITKDKFKILAYGGKDKYGDLGIIGYALYSLKNEIITVHDWVMSCRAFGLKLEHQMLDRLMDYNSPSKVRVQYRQTERNSTALSFLKNLNISLDIVDKVEIRH